LNPAPAALGERRALVVILGGVVAALHIGKLPGAVTALQQSLSITLVQAGFLLSLVQFAGMTAGLAFGALADRLGLRRSMLLGLTLLAAAAPPLVRRLVPPQRLARALGVWGAYMPAATALALLAGPLVIAAVGWRGWWWLLAAVTAAMAVMLARAVPPLPEAAPAPGGVAVPWPRRVRDTLAASGPWLVAVPFAVYSAQWLAVIGFLPTIYEQAGVGAIASGALTALAAAGNIVGNVAGGRLLHRGVAAPRLLATGFVVMGLAGVAAFAAGPLPPALRYAAVLVFSMVGGVIPATLFALALRVAPGEHTMSATVGWMQQWSALGQFCGPPLVAWLAGIAGGWHWTGYATATLAAAGLLSSAALAARLARMRA
jgi:MFS transporter, CP family, cyanate transporter